MRTVTKILTSSVVSLVIVGLARVAFTTKGPVSSFVLLPGIVIQFQVTGDMRAVSVLSQVVILAAAFLFWFIVPFSLLVIRDAFRRNRSRAVDPA